MPQRAPTVASLLVIAIATLAACASDPDPRTDAAMTDGSATDAIVEPDACAPTPQPGFSECTATVVWSNGCWPDGLTPGAGSLAADACASLCPSLPGDAPLTCVSGGGHGELHLYCSRC